MKLVSFVICPFVQRIAALLEAKKAPYEIEYIDLSNKPQWFLDISPNGQVPVLITDEGAIFESEAIYEYLEEISPSLDANRSPYEKSMYRAWSYLGVKNYMVQCALMRSSDADTLKERSDIFGKALDKIENVLDEHQFFHGNALTRVDISWFPLLHRAYIIQENTGFDMIGARPKIKNWQKNLMQTGLDKSSVAEDFVEQFKGFYLSDKTYLGAGHNVAHSNYADAETAESIMH
ncbi:MAG: glutathione S-transferase family protein [Cellvibrionales bacterium]|nr:glutathione S-transferase family protein [Cellvibrionales bacterium]